MGITQIGMAALIIYLCTAVWQGTALSHGKTASRTPLLSLIGIAIALHGFSVIQLINTPAGFNLGFFQVSSLIFWVMCTVLFISSFKLPVENLFVIQLPLSALGIFFSLNYSSGFVPSNSLAGGIGWHVLLSILAYSILTIATIQALALALQENLLRKKHFQGVLNALPPLQTMEALLFEMLWAGTVLLTLSLGTGFMFFEDAFEQHLSHKMAFSSVAWLIYVILLWGRTTKGWRGKTAIWWSIGGFIALMLAYFGSKFVLEVVLQKS